MSGNVQCYNGMCGDEGTCDLGDMCPVYQETRAYWAAYFGPDPVKDYWPNRMSDEQIRAHFAWERGFRNSPDADDE